MRGYIAPPDASADLWAPMDMIDSNGANMMGRWIVRRGYYEIEWAARGSSEECFVLTIVPRKARSFWVGACLGDYLDTIHDAIEGPDELLAQQCERTLREVWPFCWMLYNNGRHDRFAPAALRRLFDPDDETDKWFVLSVAGNLPLRTDPIPEDRLAATRAQVPYQADDWILEAAHINWVLSSPSLPVAEQNVQTAIRRLYEEVRQRPATYFRQRAA